jgi:TolB-like protein
LQRPKIQSLAVLPLANLSGDPSQDYFADGMTDELITELAKIRSLRGTKARKLRCRRLRRSSG